VTGTTFGVGAELVTRVLPLDFLLLVLARAAGGRVTRLYQRVMLALFFLREPLDNVVFQFVRVVFLHTSAIATVSIRVRGMIRFLSGVTAHGIRPLCFLSTLGLHGALRRFSLTWDTCRISPKH
jgi:hypothetical protein